MNSPIIEKWDFAECDTHDILRMFGKGILQTVYDFKISVVYFNRGERTTKDSLYRERGQQGFLLLNDDQAEWERVSFISDILDMAHPKNLKKLLQKRYDVLYNKEKFDDWIIKGL